MRKNQKIEIKDDYSEKIIGNYMDILFGPMTTKVFRAHN
jgi:hypothetical protein